MASADQRSNVQGVVGCAANSLAIEPDGKYPIAASWLWAEHPVARKLLEHAVRLAAAARLNGGEQECDENADDRDHD